MQRNRRGWVVVVGLSSFALGCGGARVSEPEPGQDAGHDSHTPDDASHADVRPPPASDAHGALDALGPWSAVCPVTAPTVNGTCTNEGVTCEYGSLQYDIACDTVLQCENGTWQTFEMAGACTPDMPNPATCPSTYAAIDQGGACSPSGETCAYADGVCNCEVFFGGVEVGDAGPTWVCNPGPGCPMPRPRLGSPCTGNTSCTYETCSFGESCQDGAWQGEFEGCASAGG
jgi:hypothetical protein